MVDEPQTRKSPAGTGPRDRKTQTIGGRVDYKLLSGRTSSAIDAKTFKSLDVYSGEHGAQKRSAPASYVHCKPVDRLLPLLHNVRKVGDGWRADCPNNHDHARGSLAISEADDGRVLLHCFACSDVHGILSAVGLEVADLFPERIKDPSPQARKAAHEAFKRNGWNAALGVIARESTVIEIAAHDLADNKALSAADHARLLLACSRVHGAREVLQ